MMELTPLCWQLLLLSTLVYCSLGQGGASLSVSPDRSQFFEFESVSLSCEVQGTSAGWRVVRNTTRENLSECNTDWGKQQGSSCIMSLVPSSSGAYWCESGSGEHSNAVNITVHDGAVILESPALPVTEGDSVTLRCRYQGTPSNLTADFYKDGSLIRTETTGEMTIPAVSKSDEGLYKCTNSEGESPESWMTVTDGAVILESPALPVTEGDSVTLRCRYQGTPSNLTADFYKDGSLIRNETTGEMTIPAVSKSDEGLYKCTNSKGESPESQMNVTDGGSTSSSSYSSLLLPLSMSGVVAALSISLIILLVLFCKRNKDVAAEPRDVTYADVRIIQDPEPRRRREKSPGADPVYSAVKTSNTTVPGGSGPGDVTYADINHTEKRQHNRRRENVVPDPVYSAVKTDRQTGQKVIPDPVYSAVKTDKQRHR
ncbi:low affinity immunoglobulin gamma Fc region receptor II-like isoform X2 [Salvelinus fontinalis]|uniref:low affinity immunoglobulin gamma Fc region receptor II-like isoform X2 n=1 Tax=Salvelinus fontinalis TaxID=8038 RepID=UPI002485C874|nr:low affinity immunoglobulin gamma Fc region receptor II-like isoform X2 [Salvelinus fontinalis]